jgi:hopanoid biosynthesis associated RND transporter like protein HpnN
MLTSAIVAIVDLSRRFAWLVAIAFLVLTGFAADFAARNFAINTDSSQLISAKLPWRQRELAFDKAFPQRADLIIAVVDAVSPELADVSARRLSEDLARQGELFKFVRRPDGGPFFEKNGLLFLSQEELGQTTEMLVRAQPFLGSLAADPTLRGLASTLSFIPQAVQAGQAKLDDFTRPISLVGDAIEEVLAGRPSRLSWSEMMTGQPPGPRDLRKFIYLKPVLDFSALEPGARAAEAIRATAKRLGLTQQNGVKVRLTGPVPMADEEFGSIADGMEINTAATVLAVLVLIWLALRSGRIILAVFLSLLSGLAITAAAGLAMVGALNLISVAFAVLFVGIGVDFGIQFAVRYRAERHLHHDLAPALRSAAAEAGTPLALAAAATAAGFFAFLPTDYRGVSELGLIAGAGMGIAFVTSITLLPALLWLLNPPGEKGEVGYAWLGPVDRFLARHRWVILALTGSAVVAGLPLLKDLTFDFNPLNLRSSEVESVSTYLDLLKDPSTSSNTVDLLAPTAKDAAIVAEKIRAVPEVASVTTIESFVPDEQEAKLAVIADTAQLLGPTLSPAETKPAPSDAETAAALGEAADAYNEARKASEGSASVAVLRLSVMLRKLADGTEAQRKLVEAQLVPGLKSTLDKLRVSLTAEPVTLARLPLDLVRDWVTSDGQARVEAAPKGDANDNETLRAFARAVLAVAPEATGTPVLIQESADTVVRAFLQAGVLAFVSITIIILVVLRRVGDLFYTLLPLVLAGIVTLELCVALGLKLNFANIIALPLLLGVGVAFKIYYVLAWRAGETSLLASSLTRAVFFSAMTTATAFGSLWMSHHPGTSSMGKLLSLSLVTTLIAAVVFQPILMGPPRNPRKPAA